MVVLKPHRLHQSVALPLLPAFEVVIEPIVLAPSDAPDALLDELCADAVETGRRVPAALALAQRWGPRLPLPGRGRTRLLWEALATVAAVDLQTARTFEPHLDALAILHEHGDLPVPASATWGVYAAEGPGARLTATRDHDAEQGETWQLTGVKPWCSLADQVSNALVTAWVGSERGLFSVDARQAGFVVQDQAWLPHGLRDVRSTAVEMTSVPAEAVGQVNWYLQRDGFAWGGIGVAAVWYGATVQLARTLVERSTRTARAPDQIAYLHVGSVDRALHAARAVLAEAADEVDAGRGRGRDGAVLAHRVRGTIATAAEAVLRHADHALGPAPLVQDAAHANRVADLHLYLRQHHAERDDAALGRMLVERQE